MAGWEIIFFSGSLSGFIAFLLRNFYFRKLQWHLTTKFWPLIVISISYTDFRPLIFKAGKFFVPCSFLIKTRNFGYILSNNKRRTFYGSFCACLTAIGVVQNGFRHDITTPLNPL